MGACTLAASGVVHAQASVRLEDAERFAKLFASTPTPSAAQLDELYLKPGSEGVAGFIKYRIKSADNLAERVATLQADYRKGIELCLPAARKLQPQAEQTIAKVQALLGRTDTAPVYMLFGGGNSGGTASSKALMLGLEVLCRSANTELEATRIITEFVAHEVTHVYQNRSMKASPTGDLLQAMLVEGFADFAMTMAMGEQAASDAERSAYGLAREHELWEKAQADFKHGDKQLRNWMYNNNTPRAAGEPADLGYWLGKRICEAYYARATDKTAALQILLEMADPAQILRDSGYQGGQGGKR
ncbi:hypothetical protein J7U46_19845 [Pelomonas sp. V22]|uniref:DUF2268 domain-containing putative Zn-dependent protease n=1 Tax=Pelomonas sp. V22 TaxID=2822139 RepID=UPI0024A9D391|nr:DUF2268 domain-containing putative Zn-dependent protease [Pelomonas sp. V22]MDI4635326.1 hypothetical protein [Pelomonas sp. V22]